jgi:acetyl esterase/lipase
MRTFANLVYADRNPQVNNLNIYLPDEGDSFPVFLYFHGAGLIHTNASIGRFPFTQYLTSHGIAVVCAAYHVYPISKGERNVNFPMFLEDAADAVNWVKSHISEYCKMEKLIIGGSSNGAYLSAMLCFDKKWLGKHGISPLDIDGFIHDAPQLTTHFSVLREKGFSNKRVIIDEAAPLFYVGTETDYPNMLFINAENDGHTRLSQTKLACTALKNLGHGDKVQSVVLSGTHCSYVNAPDQDGENEFGKLILNFINKK